MKLVLLLLGQCYTLHFLPVEVTECISTGILLSSTVLDIEIEVGQLTHCCSTALSLLFDCRCERVVVGHYFKGGGDQVLTERF